MESVNDSHEDIWDAVPDVALHPVRVAVIEAFRWTEEPLSAIGLVDVLDGFVCTSEAAYHLRCLEALDVIEAAPLPVDRPLKREAIEAPYRLKARGDAD
ncbi:MAG TPA: hypothetical protein VH703_01275 [Solirubrobacterales bacterium]|jgi:hypothetical protein